MKYRTRSVICSLLAGLIILTNSCRSKESPQLTFVSSKQLKDFPSASAIEYDDGSLYVFGDDAAYLLILDTAYNKLDTIHYLADTSYRIAKETKPDIEGATIISYNDEKHLYAIGSFSGEHRMRLLYSPLPKITSFVNIDYSGFKKQLNSLPEINIEGLAFAKSKLVMANRANTTHRLNTLIVTDNNFLTANTDGTKPHFIDVILQGQNVIGISGLYYLEEKDLLLFTASEEDTPNAMQDGTINDSYLGMIENFSEKMEENEIKPNYLINLSSINKIFRQQKIESVCVQEVAKDKMILHLAADNDNGTSTLFKMKLSYQ